MNNGTACKIVGGCAKSLGDRAIRRKQTAVPHHVGHWGVVEGDPQRDEDHPRAVLDAFGDGTADERDGDHGECGLECDVDAGRVVVAVEAGGGEHAILCNHGVTKQEAGGRVAEHTADRIAGVGDGPAPQAPDDHRDGKRCGLHDEHVEHGLGTDHATIEQRHARRHKKHQAGARQYPRGVAGIKLTHANTPLFSILSIRLYNG